MDLTYSALARASAAHDGDALAGLELEVYIRQDIGAVQVVPNGDVAEFNLATSGPVLGDDLGVVIRILALVGVRFVMGIFRLQLDVLLDTVEL